MKPFVLITMLLIQIELLTAQSMPTDGNAFERGHNKDWSRGVKDTPENTGRDGSLGPDWQVDKSPEGIKRADEIERQFKSEIYRAMSEYEVYSRSLCEKNNPISATPATDKIDEAVQVCFWSDNAPNTLAGKWRCFFKEKGVTVGDFIERGMENLSPNTGSKTLDKMLEDLRTIGQLQDAIKKREAVCGKISLEVSPVNFMAVHAVFSPVSYDGNATNFRAVNYDRVHTQERVDIIRVIDSRAEIHFNDPKIVGVKQDNNPEHDGKIKVAWSSDPLTPEGMIILARSNPELVDVALKVAEIKREEALAEYNEFDLSFAKEYLKVGNSHLWAELIALCEKHRAHEKEKQAITVKPGSKSTFKVPRLAEAIAKRRELVSQYNGTNPKLLLEKKLILWEREEPKLVSSLSDRIMEHLKTADPIAIETTKKVLQKLNERNGEQADFKFVIECSKNQDPIALMAALKALEEKCCDPAEAERRKALRETKAAERRKARYEAVKARLERERRERYEAWLREHTPRQQHTYSGGGEKGNRD